MVERPARRVEEELVGLLQQVVSLAHLPLAFQQALDLIHQAAREMARSPMPGLRVLRRKVNTASAEVDVLELNPNELTDSASEFVDDLHHQLVAIVLNGIEESPQFINCQIPYRLAKSRLLN